MHALLTNTGFQAVLAPFLVALLAAELLQRMRLSGLAIIAGFAITVYLTSGFTYEPLTGTRKIIWIGLASALLAVPLGIANWSFWRPLFTVLAAGAAVWVALPNLSQLPLSTALQWGAGYTLFICWIVFWMDTLHEHPVRAASAGMALGLGAGATLIIAGASLLGKFGLAVGSAAFAFLFIMLVSNSRLSSGRSFTLPLSLIAGLGACLALLTTKLPWYTLAALAAIPFAAKLPVSDHYPLWAQTTLLSSATLACAFVAVYSGWHTYGQAAF